MKWNEKKRVGGRIRIGREKKKRLLRDAGGKSGHLEQKWCKCIEFTLLQSFKYASSFFLLWTLPIPICAQRRTFSMKESPFLPNEGNAEERRRPISAIIPSFNSSSSPSVACPQNEASGRGGRSPWSYAQKRRRLIQRIRRGRLRQPPKPDANSDQGSQPCLGPEARVCNLKPWEIPNAKHPNFCIQRPQELPWPKLPREGQSPLLEYSLRRRRSPPKIPTREKVVLFSR